MSSKEKVVAYVDGFNLYFGMLEAGLNDYKWLDVVSLVKSLLKNNQELARVKYFTSRVSNNPDKQKRQTTYIEAIMETGVDIFYGHYQSGSIECHVCGDIRPAYNEKMTDVNIATQLLCDAYQDSFDTAMLISGDSDLVPPVKAIHKIFSKKRVFVAFPPKRHNQSVAISAKGSLQIGKKKIKDAQLPLEISKKDGFILKKPKEWSPT